MSKKLLLLALPALMVLSSCGARTIEKPVNNQPALEMCEDNLAHEEIFGGEQDTAILTKKNPYRLVTLTSASVKIGYQIQFNANGEGTADDTISIRFVAALTDAVASADWHRGLAQPNSYEGAEVSKDNWKYKFGDGTSHPSTVFYTALNNGGARVAAGEGDFVGYNSFAIYTLMNIPYETYKDSYLAAYVTLTSDNTINSQAVAVKIEKNGTASKNRFFFNPDTTGHFLQGTIGGTLRDGTTNNVLYATEYDSGSFYASYNDVSFDDEDSFGSFYFGSGHFQFFGKTAFFDGSSKYFDAADDLNDYCSPKADGTYSLYVYGGSTGSENHVYATGAAGDVQTYHIKGLPSWIGDGNAKVFASVKYSDNSWNWLPVTYEGTSGTFSAPNNSKAFLLVRCHKDTTTPNWGEGSDVAGKIYNQTSPDTDITFGLFIYSPSW